MWVNMWSVPAIWLILGITNAQECKTSKNENGDCIEITKCDSMFNILQNKPISADNVKYLLKSQCGSVNKNPKVCCPFDTPDSIQKPPEQEVSTISSRNTKLDPLPNLNDCGIGEHEDRIVGGEKTSPGQFPWSAVLLYTLNGEIGINCGGVLISKRYVLTAAHCVSRSGRRKLIAARLGEYDTNTLGRDCITDPSTKEVICSGPAIDIPIEEFVVHPNYKPLDRNQYNDIALLRLAKEVTFNDYIVPICLPSTVEELAGNFSSPNFVVTGWGRTENQTSSNIKLKLSMKKVPFNECSATYSTQNVVLGNGQMCAGGKAGKDSCKGDSGGPLMAVSRRPGSDVHWVSAGVVSMGPNPCGLEGWPGIYTEVWKYVKWIKEEVRN